MPSASFSVGGLLPFSILRQVRGVDARARARLHEVTSLAPVVPSSFDGRNVLPDCPAVVYGHNSHLP